MTQPVVFISYSHKDEREKDGLLSHLGVLQSQGLIGLWSDDQIGAGTDWKQEISEAMAQAKVAILLISANFLTSDFILREEVPTLLKRRQSEGLTVFPVITKACAWQEVDWLTEINVRPKNGRPIWGGSRRVDEDLAAIAKEVAAIVKTSPHITPTSSSVHGKSQRAKIDYILSYHTQNFIGREWVFEAVEDFIARHSCGYFCIVADAGLGKTAIATQLVKRYQAIIHFFNKSPGLIHTDQCLDNLIEQLIARYKLEYDHLGGSLGKDSSFLSMLLEEISQQSDDTPLVIVIDAVDEADPTPPGHNWLHLPDRLPQGVFFILTQRPGNFLLKTEPNTPSEPFHITWDDPRHQTDIDAHLRRQAESPEIAQILQDISPPISAGHFVNELHKASEGNFMYLHFVLEDIREREFGYDLSQLLTQLPHGLEGYYKKFWDQMEKEPGDEGYNVWRQTYLPVISVLGAAREPVTAEQIATWSNMGIEEVYPALSNWRRGWRRFISSQEQAGQETWSVIHRSFTDFLEKELRPTSELRKMHSGIAGWYLTTWGGLEAGLPELLRSSPEQAVTQYYHYGVSHLVSHLSKAERTDDLHALLQLNYVREDGQTVNLWYEAHKLFGQPGSYLADVEQAQHTTEQEGPAGISKLVRYALMHSSINSLTPDLPVEWLIALVSQGAWSPAQALTYARNIANPEQQTRYLSFLADILRQLGHVKERRLAAERAWELITKMQSHEEQAATFYTLIPSLPHHLISQALELAREFKHSQTRAELLIALGTRLEEEGRAVLTQEILETIRQVEPIGYAMTTTPQRQLLNWLPQPLTQIRLFVPRERETEAISKALAKARNRSSIFDRVTSLIELLPQLPRQQVPKVLSETLSLARKSKNDFPCVAALLAAFYWLVLREEGWSQINDECRHTIHAIQTGKIRFLLSLLRVVLVKVSPFTSRLLSILDNFERKTTKSHQGKFLSGKLNASLRNFFYYQYSRPANVKVAQHTQLMLHLASFLLPTPAEETKVLFQAIEATREIEDDVVRACTLTQLALQLREHPKFHPEVLLAEAFAITEQLSDEYERAKVLAILSPIAQKIGRSDLIGTALSTATALEDPYIKARILTDLLPFLDEQDRALAFETAQQAAQAIGPGEDYYQAEVLTDLAGSMSDPADQESLINQVTELVQRLKDPLDKAEVLSRVVPISPPEKGIEYFRAALKNILSIENPSLRAQALVGLSQLLPVLPDEEESKNFFVNQWQNLLQWQIQDPVQQNHSINLGTIRLMLASINDDLWFRVRILSQLPADVLRQIVERPPFIGSEYSRILYANLVGTRLVRVYKEADVWPNLLVKVLPHLSVNKKEVTLSKIEAWMVRQDLNKQAVTKTLLLPFASKKGIAETREFASDIPDVIARADALSVLTEEYLTGRKRESVFQEILSTIAHYPIEDKSRAEILSRLTPNLPPDLLNQAVDIVKSFQDDIAFAETMSELIPQLPEDGQANMASETLARVRNIEEHHIRADLLIRFAPFQSKQEQPAVLQEALKAILLIEDNDLAQLWMSSSSSSSQVLNFHLNFGYVLSHSRTVYSANHPRFPNQIKGFTSARFHNSLKHSPAGLKIYFRLILFERETGSINQAEKTALFDKEFGSPSAALAQPDSQLPSTKTMFGNWGKYVQVWISPIGRPTVRHYSHPELLSRLCPLLPPESLAQAIEMMSEIENVKERAMALATLASHLSGSEAESIFDRAVELADIIEEPPYPQDFTGGPSDFRVGTVRIRAESDRTYYEFFKETEVVRRAYCFMHIADKMAGDRRTTIQSKALEAAQLISARSIGMITLVRFAINLSPELKTKVWDAVRANIDEWAATLDIGSLVALAPLWSHIPQDISYQLISKALQTLAHRPRSDLLQGLDALTPIIGQQQDTKAADEIADTILDTLKWWP